MLVLKEEKNALIEQEDLEDHQGGEKGGISSSPNKPFPLVRIFVHEHEVVLASDIGEGKVSKAKEKDKGIHDRVAKSYLKD